VNVRASVSKNAFQSLKRSARDALVLAAVVAFAFFASAYFDLFEAYHHFLDTHEEWEIDELIPAGLLLAFGALLFSIRRIFDLRAAHAQAY